MREAHVVNLGQIGYLECWDLQTKLAQQRLSERIPDTLLALEHPSVLTLGANFHEQNLLLTREQYSERGIEVIKTDRGGDVTFHGPNQLVLYPIFDLKAHGKDVHVWMRNLEQATIELCNQFGLKAERFAPHTGVWVSGKKVAAIGVKISKWISTHGIAINSNNDLEPFNLIVPCGIVGYGVTSLSREAKREVTVADALSAALPSFEKVFNLKCSMINREELEASLVA